jgi:hypothetical protein
MPTLPLGQVSARRARWAAIGAVALLPLSYVWLVAPRDAVGWVFPLTATAEIGAIVLGLVAVAYSIRARRLMPHGTSMRWPMLLGGVVLALVVIGNAVGIALSE